MFTAECVCVFYCGPSSAGAGPKALLNSASRLAICWLRQPTYRLNPVRWVAVPTDFFYSREILLITALELTSLGRASEGRLHTS